MLDQSKPNPKPPLELLVKMLGSSFMLLKIKSPLLDGATGA